jgi:signal peptidase
MTTATRAGRLVGPALVAVSLLCFAFLGVGPRTGQYRTLTVLTASMRPAIPPGALVVVVPVDHGDLRPGDVVTYQAPLGDRRVVTHRVVGVRMEAGRAVLRTRGDANARPDPWEARLGPGPAWEVRAVVPHAGTAIQALRSPFVRQATVWAAPLLLAVLWLGGIWRAAPVRPPVPPVPPVRRPPGPAGLALGLAALALLTARRRRRRSRSPARALLA